MRFFKRRKREKTLAKKFDEMNASILSEQDKKNPKKVEHYVVERLQQIIEQTKEINEEKSEYKMIAAYVNDIHTIDGLSGEEKEYIRDIAQNIVGLNQARYEFLHAEKKISDAQYMQMQQEEEDIPNAVRRLKANEDYLELLKKDMKYLEREKDEWLFYREDLQDQKSRMQNIMYVILGLSVCTGIVLAILQFIFSIPMKMGWTLLIFAMVVAICVTYLKIMNADTEYKKAEVNANRAIVLLNQVKVKYVNITNAIDYACEKYHVTSSNELNRVWEAYLEAIKQKEKFEKNSEDLEYYSNRLIRVLAKYHLYDTKVWVPQALALVDHKEMVEVTHSLVARRQKLRSKMEYSIGVIKTQREEIIKLIRNMDTESKTKVLEIMESIDQMSGV